MGASCTGPFMIGIQQEAADERPLQLTRVVFEVELTRGSSELGLRRGISEVGLAKASQRWD